MDYGKILKGFRETAGFTQQELADLLNRSRSCISKFESNRKLTDIATFREWVKVTNCEFQAMVVLFGTDIFANVSQALSLVPAFIRVISIF
ncbi:helix-turn-helix transcriptional regulator [Solibacillus sp. A46]|uniref:Helix-turn-helix transcriptional regulator n=1 Tax=Solibacillus faecavium TaxID=2762221 RepID=A0ABR8XYU8_9BACL|nr:helix-turn-helix transcriptional regulator [Solibacillus faecavium]MBD8037126.1 helix-turn-helix transcriptional regulator [Solibacillus faecavium]